eukprot:scaffold25307_cov47-Tisochrysis_lutea.AAC.2
MSDARMHARKVCSQYGIEWLWRCRPDDPIIGASKPIIGASNPTTADEPHDHASENSDDDVESESSASEGARRIGCRPYPPRRNLRSLLRCWLATRQQQRQRYRRRSNAPTRHIMRTPATMLAPIPPSCGAKMSGWAEGS